MLLGDPDVVDPVRKLLLDLDQAGPLEHRRRDRDDLRVLLHHRDQRFREDLRVGEADAGAPQARGRPGLVELRGILLRLLETAALVGQRVDDDGRPVLRDLLRASQRLLELPEVMTWIST